MSKWVRHAGMSELVLRFRDGGFRIQLALQESVQDRQQSSFEGAHLPLSKPAACTPCGSKRAADLIFERLTSLYDVRVGSLSHAEWRAKIALYCFATYAEPFANHISSYIRVYV